MLAGLQKGNDKETQEWLEKVQTAAIQNKNMFEILMETCKHASLGQITHALFEVGGQYRRNM
jgi:methylmalonyl-CoA mutase